MNTVAKCTCEACDGEGHVVCEECNGIGEFSFDILENTPAKNHVHFSELMEIHKDAIIVADQTERLIEMKPEHQESYARQCAATLETLTERAALLLNY